MHAILIVENETPGGIAAALDAHGYRVLMASCGVEALAVAQAHYPSLVLIDGELADRDRSTLCRRIKAIPGLEACYCVLLVSGGEVGPIAGLAEGVDDLWCKICLPGQLETRIRAALRVVEIERHQKTLALEAEVWKEQAERNRRRAAELTIRLAETMAQAHAVPAYQAGAEMALARRAAGLRHDLANPLFAVTANAECALKRLRALPEAGLPGIQDMKASLECILKAAERLQEVMEGLTT